MDITTDFVNRCIHDADRVIYKLEYHDGFHAVTIGTCYDDAKSSVWKEGYEDAMAALYGND